MSPKSSAQIGVVVGYSGEGVIVALKGNYTVPNNRFGTAQQIGNPTGTWLGGPFQMANLRGVPDYPPARPDWWRCDGCGHANEWEHLCCPHCGAQLPERYDRT